MKLQFPITCLCLAALIAVGGCKKSAEKIDDHSEVAAIIDDAPVVKGDSMLYGLSCDGTSDSVVVLWPFYGDPITISCIDAKESGKVIGKPEIGDWIGVMRDPQDSTLATMVVNLDALKGTWTYPVMPVMKEFQSMSRRAQRRMMAHIDDSIKENFLIPREYGFTLKRNQIAQAVGRVMRSNTLEDDSPVIYPPVKNYVKWDMLNGNLILISREGGFPGTKDARKATYSLDTLQFIGMNSDSLILEQNGIRYNFHRRLNAMEANKEAQEKAMKQ